MQNRESAVFKAIESLAGLGAILTPTRQRYAWFAGTALWAAWCVSLLIGPGPYDSAGQIVGADFMQYYASGHALREGHSALLYDFAYFEDLEIRLMGEDIGPPFFYFITPPFLAWLFVPFSYLPYPAAFALWSALGIALLVVGMGVLDPARRWTNVLWALTWFPVFAALTFGQNALLSFGVFVLVYWLWQKDQRFLAGVALALIMYKPQLSLGIGLLWLLRIRQDWPALVGVCAGTLGLGLASLYFLPEATREYMRFAVEDLPTMSWGEGFPLWHAHSLRAFFLLLNPYAPIISEGLALGLAGLGTLLLSWAILRNPSDKPILFSLAICLTVWITPHAMIYDWSPLLIPAVLLWRAVPDQRGLWRVLFALVWIASFVAGPLVVAQRFVVPIALQVTVPVLAIALLAMLVVVWNERFNETLTPDPA